MSRRQRTFELIPTSLINSNGPKPPMTSKMVKKAHQLATRRPKVSRAEQRRRDAEELATQKKEYEREKASARANAAREKKAAKEQAERNARKEMGIPEPSKFVRASQPTISRFVKNGNKRTWQEMDTIEEKFAFTVCDEEGEQEDKVLEPSTKKVNAGDESEDEYGGFPSFSQSDIGVVLETIENSVSSEGNQKEQIDRGVIATPKPIPKSKHTHGVLAVKKNNDEFAFGSSYCSDAMATTQLLSEAADTAKRSTEEQASILQPAPILGPSKPIVIGRPATSIPKAKPTYISRQLVTNATPVLSTPAAKPAHAPSKPVTTIRLALQERSANMPPPPLPVQVKEEKSILFGPSPPKPRVPPRFSQPVTTPDLPPSATQAFLEDHLEDFFPSPSQEIRELLDDIDDLPTNTQIARELGPSIPDAKELNEVSFSELICTQDFILSSEDILEITTPCPPPSKLKTAEKPTSTPTPLPTKPSTKQPGQSRRRFFEEKDEDLLHAAIRESKMFAIQKEQKAQKRESSGRVHTSKILPVQNEQMGLENNSSGAGRILKRTHSNATDYGEDEFHDCEKELLALC